MCFLLMCLVVVRTTSSYTMSYCCYCVPKWMFLVFDFFFFFFWWGGGGETGFRFVLSLDTTIIDIDRKKKVYSYISLSPVKLFKCTWYSTRSFYH